MRKLHNVGIRGRLYDWIADFLKDRMQCVQVDGSSSKVQSWAPLLFIIYVNDLEKAARSALMAAFADDTRLSKAIRGEATEEDMFLLSMELHQVISWALANNMELNESKFDLLCYSYRPAAKLFRSFPFTQSLYEYETPSGTLINSTKCVRDLGVHMSSDYTWSAHISTIVGWSTLFKPI